VEQACTLKLGLCYPEHNATVLRLRLQKLYGRKDVFFAGDSFPEGEPHNVFRHADLVAFAEMSHSEKTILFIRRDISLAALSSLERFAVNTGRLSQAVSDPAFDDFVNLHRELEKVETSAAFLEAYHNAICTMSSGARFDSVRCLEASYEGLCSGESASWSAILLAGRATRLGVHMFIDVVQRLREGIRNTNSDDPVWDWWQNTCVNRKQYNPDVLSYTRRFFGIRSRMLYPHAAADG